MPSGEFHGSYLIDDEPNLAQVMAWYRTGDILLPEPMIIQFTGTHHYSDVIMSEMASQITSVSTGCSNVCSRAHQGKQASPASQAFVRGIHWWPVDFPHKRPVTRKICPLDDVIMICLRGSLLSRPLSLNELLVFPVDQVHIVSTCVCTCVCIRKICFTAHHYCLFKSSLLDMILNYLTYWFETLRLHKVLTFGPTQEFERPNIAQVFCI